MFYLHKKQNCSSKRIHLLGDLGTNLQRALRSLTTAGTQYESHLVHKN